MKALVTGAGGFIGRRLVARLRAENYDVVALVHRQPAAFDPSEGVVQFVGDIRDEAAMKKAAENCDAVFHLAAKVHALSEVADDQAEYDQVNVDGTRNVLDA